MLLYQTLMNELKNSTSNGTYVQPIPLGMQITLTYSDKGILNKVITDSGIEIPFETVVKIQNANVFPQRLKTYKAACEVVGVLVANVSEFKLTKCAGDLPVCVYPSLLKLANTKPEKFKFYALDVKIANSQPLPATSAMSRLAMMKFTTLNGLAVNSSANISNIVSQFNRTVSALGIGVDIITGLYFHRTRDASMYLDLKCGLVKKFDYFLDINGYVHGELKCDLGAGITDVTVPYSQIVQNQMSGNSFVILDKNNNIQYVSQPKVFSRVASSTITCPVCGKKYAVNPSLSNVSCVDVHCASMLYPQICRMLSKFNLEPMTEDQFIVYTRTGKIKSLKDVFNLSEYKDCEVVTTLSNFLEAITPVSLVAGDPNSIAKFVLQSSSGTAVSYYIHNPEMIFSDLKVNRMFAEKFKDYWSDTYNSEMYDAFLEIPEIRISAPKKKFNGDLIFRNKLICLTGEFKHGSYDEMISILSSYAGTPTVEFTSQVSFILVGHIGNPDPYIIERARAYNIPIYRELDFFEAYQIDKDLLKFHLI